MARNILLEYIPLLEIVYQNIYIQKYNQWSWIDRLISNAS